MNDFHIQDVNARVVQFADNINNMVGRTSAEVACNAFRLLDRGMYRESSGLFVEALGDAPSDQNLHFGIAVARLGGTRPHRHTRDSAERIVRHLRAAADLPHALLLELLVAEDRGLYWQRVRSKAIPQHILLLAAAVPSVQARRILTHVPAREARVWRALDAVDRQRGEPRS